MRDYEECRPYIDHILAEHRRLHRLLCSTRAAIVHSVGPDCDASFTEVARILKRLRDQLSDHFAEEEGGGCLDEAVSRCPRLSSAEKRIEAEHPVILAKLDHLIDQAAKLRPNVNNQIALKHAFDELYAALCAHERAENILLQEGFGESFNGDDFRTKS